MNHERGYSRGITVGSPCENMLSGYSSTSPPATESSGSSTNSQSYGGSPDDLSVDSLITSLLQVVNTESLSSCGNSLLSANGVTFGSSWCGGDCKELTCEWCHDIRQNRPSSNNQLVQFGSSPLTMGQTSASVSPSFTAYELYCHIHQQLLRLYCQTCSRSLCMICGRYYHCGHVMINLLDAIEVAGIQATQVISNARQGIAVLRAELDTVEIAVVQLERKARQATIDVTSCVRRVFTALRARESELLDRIEKERLLKYAALKTRDEGLRNGIARLSRAVNKIINAMETSTNSGNPLDLCVTKDIASSEIFRVRQSRQNLPPIEDNWFPFTGPEGAIFNTIANLGSIMTNNNLGPIGDRRAVRGRGTSPQPTSQNSPLPLPMGPFPQGMRLSFNRYPVTFRSGRNMFSPSLVRVIGNTGEPHNNLCRPWGVACDTEGNIVIADRSNNCVQIFREDGSFVRKYGSYGTAFGQFDRPAGIVVDGRKRIIVADKDNHRIQIHDMEGRFLLSFGEKGAGCGEFNYPWGVAVNSECQIAVSDTRNHRIQLFSPEGIFLRKYGSEVSPSMWKTFDSPRGIAFNPEGKVVTTDFNNHHILVIEPDFQTANVLECETKGAIKPFLRPQGLVIDDAGNMIIADSRNHRILVYNPSGTLLWQFGSFGKGDNEMDRPSGLALTASGKIAVVDFGNNRVLII